MHRAPRSVIQLPDPALPHLDARQRRHHHQKHAAETVDAHIPAGMDERPAPVARLLFHVGRAEAAAAPAVRAPHPAGQERELGDGPGDREGQRDEGHRVGDEEAVVWARLGAGWGDLGVVDVEGCGEEGEGGGGEREDDDAGKDDGVGAGSGEIGDICHSVETRWWKGKGGFVAEKDLYVWEVSEIS